ncbi:MAG: DUF3037 domain-containing protein [Rhodanobacter sp.]|nr:MAG: DUF3037 domain-containing protein [Rhodanobacter sp.]
MNRFACQYAIIRFLPYAETGEFANVGVVLACPATGYFGARLMPVNEDRPHHRFLRAVGQAHLSRGDGLSERRAGSPRRVGA